MGKRNRERLILVDGHALIHRAYHAYPKNLITKKGELVNAVYGFTANLFSIFKELQPQYVAVAFDLKGPTFRHQAFKDYKRSRVKADEDLINQIDRVKQVVKVLNIPIFEVAGFEADDVIGTLAKQVCLKNKKQRLKIKKSEDLEIVIATGDRDALQLLEKEVKVFFPSRGRIPACLVGEEDFRKQYGFEPGQLVDFKALAGDASDDIPGVKGIGPKKATKIIKQFQSIKNLYRQLNQSQNLDIMASELGLSKKDVEKLKNSQKQAKLSEHLATIVTNVPIRLRLNDCRLTDYNKDKAVKLFQDLEFRTLINRLPGEKEKELETDQSLAEKPKKQQMKLF